MSDWFTQTTLTQGVDTPQVRESENMVSGKLEKIKPALKQGIYPATYFGTKEDIIKKDGKNSDIWRHYFEFPGTKDKKGNAVVLNIISDRKITKGNKAGKLAKELLGGALKENEEFDFTKFEGAKFMVTIKDDENGEYSRISDFIRDPSEVPEEND